MKTKAALAGGLRKPRQSRLLKIAHATSAAPEAGALLDFLTSPPPFVAPARPSPAARSRFLRARAALRRAEGALTRPWRTEASLAIDVALVALESAQAELEAFDEEDPDEEGSS